MTDSGPDADPEPAKEPPTETRRQVLRRVAKKDTAPELSLRRELHARGLRYRLHVPVPGMHRRSMDVSLSRARIAVFVDGCFWHGCPEHFHLPAHNREWWQWKLTSVQNRDAHTTAALTAAGWTVVRVWEHEDMAAAATRIHRLWAGGHHRARPEPGA